MANRLLILALARQFVQQGKGTASMSLALFMLVVILQLPYIYTSDTNDRFVLSEEASDSSESNTSEEEAECIDKIISFDHFHSHIDTTPHAECMNTSSIFDIKESTCREVITPPPEYV